LLSSHCKAIRIFFIHSVFFFCCSRGCIIHLLPTAANAFATPPHITRTAAHQQKKNLVSLNYKDPLGYCRSSCRIRKR
jgi:hypothetical protein